MGNDLGKALQGAADAVNSSSGQQGQQGQLPFPNAWPIGVNPAFPPPAPAPPQQQWDPNAQWSTTKGQTNWDPNAQNKKQSWAKKTWDDKSWQGYKKGGSNEGGSNDHGSGSGGSGGSSEYLRACKACGRAGYLRNGLCLNEEC
ncbi:unnamed protein product, partial [Symbiodinium sp. CCMP2592]